MKHEILLNEIMQGIMLIGEHEEQDTEASRKHKRELEQVLSFLNAVSNSDVCCVDIIECRASKKYLGITLLFDSLTFNKELLMMISKLLKLTSAVSIDCTEENLMCVSMTIPKDN